MYGHCGDSYRIERDCNNDLAEDDAAGYNSGDRDLNYVELQERIRETYKTIEHLRNCLAIAKKHLEMERLQSQTLLHGYRSVNVRIIWIGRNSARICYHRPFSEIQQNFQHFLEANVANTLFLACTQHKLLIIILGSANVLPLLAE